MKACPNCLTEALDEPARYKCSRNEESQADTDMYQQALATGKPVRLTQGSVCMPAQLSHFVPWKLWERMFLVLHWLWERSHRFPEQN